MRDSERKITNCYSCLECNLCKNTSKRKFKPNDFVFKICDKCSECDGDLLVTMIFGHTIE